MNDDDWPSVDDCRAELARAYPCGSVLTSAPTHAPNIASTFMGGKRSKTTRPMLRLMTTTKPQARVRVTVFLGAYTASMVHDRQPITDVFRGVDDDTVLGLMDQRGDVAPEPFSLSCVASGARHE